MIRKFQIKQRKKLKVSVKIINNKKMKNKFYKMKRNIKMNNGTKNGIMKLSHQKLCFILININLRENNIQVENLIGLNQME